MQNKGALPATQRSQENNTTPIMTLINTNTSCQNSQAKRHPPNPYTYKDPTLTRVSQNHSKIMCVRHELHKIHRENTINGTFLKENTYFSHTCNARIAQPHNATCNNKVPNTIMQIIASFAYRGTPFETSKFLPQISHREGHYQNSYHPIIRSTN